MFVIHSSIGDLKKYNAEHLIRTHPEESDHTYYLEDQASKRHSVLAKVPELQPGSNEVSIGYKFMDLGSCAGGLNRRETAIIFTLEFA